MYILTFATTVTKQTKTLFYLYSKAEILLLSWFQPLLQYLIYYNPLLPQLFLISYLMLKKVTVLVESSTFIVFL
jgi:hypothetical protein